MCQIHHSFRVRLALGAAIACSAWLLRAEPAAACGACSCFEATAWDSEFGDFRVPRNARMLVPAPNAAAIRMRSTDGTAVTIETTPAGADGLFWVKARELLRADASYVIEVAAANDVFTTVLGLDVLPQTDDTPLQVASVTIEASEGSAICDLDRGATVTLTGVRDEQLPGHRVIAQLDLTSGARTQRVFLPFDAITNTQTADVAALTPSGNSKCTFARTFVLDDRDAQASARVTLYDLGGNATVLPEPIVFGFGAVQGGACPPSMSLPTPAQTMPVLPPVDAGSAQDVDAGQSGAVAPVAGTAASTNNGRGASSAAGAAGTVPADTTVAGSAATHAVNAGSAAPSAMLQPKAAAANGGGCGVVTVVRSPQRVGLALVVSACLLGLQRRRRRVPNRR